jgi:GTPase SAR1 family protein
MCSLINLLKFVSSISFLKGVGKSWLLMRWAGEGNKLKGNSMPTIGIDFKLKNVDVNGKKVKVQVVSE